MGSLHMPALPPPLDIFSFRGKHFSRKHNFDRRFSPDSIAALSVFRRNIDSGFGYSICLQTA